MLQNKQGYFQGTEEPTPKKKKYKSDRAITVQPRFKEPLFKNYDLYETKGEDGLAKHGPGTGLYQNMEKYKSVKDFIDKKRKRNKYKADDSHIEDTISNREDRISKMKVRSRILYKITKIAIDFPIDDNIDPNLAHSNSDSNTDTSLGNANHGGGYLDKYLPMDDFENKPPSALNFGRDYTDDVEDSKELDLETLEALIEKYTNEQKGLYGMPDGVNLQDGELRDPTDINPYYGTIDSENTLYDKLFI